MINHLVIYYIYICIYKSYNFNKLFLRYIRMIFHTFPLGGKSLTEFIVYWESKQEEIKKTKKIVYKKKS